MDHLAATSPAPAPSPLEAPTEKTRRSASTDTPTAKNAPERLALTAFAVAAVGMAVAVLVIGRHQWFFNDDWDFVATRTIGNLNSLFRPHYGHWSTGEVVVDRLLYNLFGLHTYIPFQLVMIALHVSIAAIVRTIMRRAGVQIWIATAAAGLYLLFGAGYEDLVWAGGMGYVAALAFGLTQLLLSDRDGPIQRGDWLGLVAGAIGLMDSGLMLVMLLVIGLSTLVRRGTRAAMFHVVPLVALYAIWWTAIGRRYPTSSPSIWSHLGLLPSWIGNEIVAAFDALGQVPGVGVAIAAFFVLGLPFVWLSSRWHGLRSRPAPWALAVGAVAFVGSNGVQRAVLYSAFGYERSSHYLDVFAAMALPAIAVSTNALVRRWPRLLPVAVAVFLIGIPGNIEKLQDHSGPYSAAFETPYRTSVIELAALPIAKHIPPFYQPMPLFAPGMTMGWLLDQRASGRLPPTPHLTPRRIADLSLSLALHQDPRLSSTRNCQPLLSPRTLSLVGNQHLHFAGTLDVKLVTPTGDSNGTRYVMYGGNTLVAWAPITILLSPPSSTTSSDICS